jgi:hypothetical protein
MPRFIKTQFNNASVFTCYSAHLQMSYKSDYRLEIVAFLFCSKLGLSVASDASMACPAKSFVIWLPSAYNRDGVLPW